MSARFVFLRLEIAEVIQHVFDDVDEECLCSAVHDLVSSFCPVVQADPFSTAKSAIRVFVGEGYLRTPLIHQACVGILPDLHLDERDGKRPAHAIRHTSRLVAEIDKSDDESFSRLFSEERKYLAQIFAFGEPETSLCRLRQDC